MEELEDGDKDSMLMNMLIKTTVDSIIQNEIIHLSNQINAYRKTISLNLLNLPDEKLVSLANLENLAEAMREGWKSWKSSPKGIKTIMDRVNNQEKPDKIHELLII